MVRISSGITASRRGLARTRFIRASTSLVRASGGDDDDCRERVDTILEPQLFPVTLANLGTSDPSPSRPRRTPRPPWRSRGSAERVKLGRKLPPPVFHPEQYLPELVNTTTDLSAMEKRVVAWRAGDGPGISLCLYGPPGTGKSEFVRHLAYLADRPLLVKRASDLISMWVGQTEEQIARAFEQARQDEAFLLFDEADSFLRDRRAASRSWEVTQVNEFLQQLEIFPGVVACTTNLMETLDQAALRRFVFKVQFKFLRPEQAVLAFRRTLAELGGGEELSAAVATEIGRIPNLAPGDFAACVRRMRGMDGRPRAEDLLAEVEAEVRVKEKTAGRVGF